MIPVWLRDLSIAYLTLGALCTIWILADELRHPQYMSIMNLIWPVTALFGTVWVLWQYFAMVAPCHVRENAHGHAAA
jgi:hypothetical protein